MSIRQVTCHAPAGHCHGCKHYKGEAEVCELAGKVIEDGGPAFPWGEHGTRLGGMSMRDYFAAKAMPAIISRLNVCGLLREEAPGDFDAIAKQAYRVADAMLKAGESDPCV